MLCGGPRMRATMSGMEVLAGAQPFRFDGGPVGVLLCHGFTGSPNSMRAWGEHLARSGYTVECPRLPGHGTSWQDLNTRVWQEWYAVVENALYELSARCDTVVVMGLSMGGCLALRLAENHPDDVAGLVLVNPSVLTRRKQMKLLPVMRFALASRRGVAGDIRKPGVREISYDRTPLRALYSLTQLWRVTRADLGKVRAPLLVLRSAVDHVVEAESTAAVVAGVSSPVVREEVLTLGWHVATLDYDAERIFAASVDFTRSVTAATAGTSAQEAVA